MCSRDVLKSSSVSLNELDAAGIKFVIKVNFKQVPTRIRK